MGNVNNFHSSFYDLMAGTETTIFVTAEGIRIKGIVVWKKWDCVALIVNEKENIEVLATPLAIYQS